MSIERIIRERRTIRAYADRPVPQQLVVKLLDAAVWAPNHGMREPWRFIYVGGEANERFTELTMAALSEYKRFKFMPAKLKQLAQQKFLQIPAHLIVLMKEESGKHKREEDFAAVCCLIQNFQLLAWEERLGMIWSTNELVCGSPLFGRGIGMQKGERIVGMMQMGYFDEAPPPKPRTPAEKKLTVF